MRRQVFTEKLLLVCMAIVFAAFAALGIHRAIREHPSHWARILPKNDHRGGPDLALQRDMPGPEPPEKLPLAEFVQGNGDRTNIVLLKGEFEDTVIQPKNNWYNLGKSLVLVSSVDEKQSAAGDLSEPISAGCSLERGDVVAALGTVSLDQCSGPYEIGGHIAWVARLSIIVAATQDACWKKYGLVPRETSYQDCVTKALKGSLSGLFGRLRDDDFKHVDGVIIPAIATGVGKLSKAAFYNTLFHDVLLDKLQSGLPLPQTLYLQVRGGPSDRWDETRIALSNATGEAVLNWDQQKHQSSDASEWLPLTGVAAACSVILLITAFGLSRRLSLFMVTGQTPSATVFLGWILAASGLVSVFKALISYFPAEVNPFFQIGAGFLAMLLCGPLTKAGKLFDDIWKPAAEAKPSPDEA